MLDRLRRMLGGGEHDVQPSGPISADAVRVRSLIFDRSDDHVIDVVGESFRQGELGALAGARGQNGVERAEHVAGLMLEPSNPVDRNAIEVQINGMRVGYLSRADAAAYHPVLERLERNRLMMGAPAILTGGWDRGGGDTGSIGVRLLVGTPAELWQEMDTMLPPEPMPAATVPTPPVPIDVVTEWDGECEGRSVCFTGASTAHFQGEPITRAMQELLAAQHGLTVLPRVTKKLDILVISAGHQRTGKVKTAEAYGTVILEERAFWSKLGVRLDPGRG